MLGGGGLDLGPIKGHPFQAYEPRLLTESEDLQEEGVEVPQVPLAEPGEGGVGGMLVGGEPAEGHILVGGAGDGAGGDGARAVAVEPELPEERGIECEIATLGVAVALGEGVQVELVLYELAEDASEVTLGEPVLQVRGEKVALMEVIPAEVGLRGLMHHPPKASVVIVPPIEVTSEPGRGCATGS